MLKSTAMYTKSTLTFKLELNLLHLISYEPLAKRNRTRDLIFGISFTNYRGQEHCKLSVVFVTS